MPRAEVIPAPRPDAVSSTSSNGQQRQEDVISKRRQPKSRGGCNICKTRRLKCDESKPSCSQCTARGVECGGYSRNLKWKPVEKHPRKDRRTEKWRVPGSAIISVQGMPPSSDKSHAAQTVMSPLQAGTSTLDTIELNELPPARVWPEHMRSMLLDGQLFQFTDVELITDLFLNDSTTDFDAPTDFGSFSDAPRGQLSEEVCNHALSQINAINADLQMEKLIDFSDLISSSNYRPHDFVEILNDGDGIPQPSDELQDTVAPAVGQPSRRFNELANYCDFHTQPSLLLDTPETVMHLFDSQICDVLSIKDDRTTNPWRIYVWPLADKCPALYHALTAMTYLYLSHSQPRFHEPGLKYLHASLQALGEDNHNASISLETSLATRLAVSFAAAWDDQQALLGRENVKIAGRLVRDAFDKHQAMRSTGSELDCLNFLARTWMYKDILVRFTNSYDGEPADIESMTTYIQLDPLPLERQLDPLLGCAITLFPFLGLLGDIIGSVRARSERHNSPSIISRGAELRILIEDWNPSFNPQRSGAVTSQISDIIQMAEAYRWAALLLLRHAVPELPWTHSIWELAEKVSIYLATIPTTSRTVVIQTFPLMAMGCEAFEKEDRNWVKQRWDAMYKRMPLARSDKCKRVTEEVWRRRDTFEAQCGACPCCGAYTLNSPAVSPDTGTPTAVDVSLSSSNDAEKRSRRCRCSAATKIASRRSSFPDSLAFKKGVDNITRAGNLNYTVRGDLHWIGVMKDWNWDSKFLTFSCIDPFRRPV